MGKIIVPKPKPVVNVPGDKAGDTPELTAQELTGKAKQLADLIQALIAEEPYECHGHLWAKKPQSWICAKLGISQPSLWRLIYKHKPPFIVTRRTHDASDKPVTLLRIGVPSPKTAHDYAQIAAALWRRKTGGITKREFGCICGLVGIGHDGKPGKWPPHLAPTLLVLVYNNWGAFMAAVKSVAPDYVKSCPEPKLSFILRFADVAIEMFVMQAQNELANKLAKKLKTGPGFHLLTAPQPADFE